MTGYVQIRNSAGDVVREYTQICNNTRMIRRETAERFGLLPGQKVEGAFLLEVVRADVDLERKHLEAQR